MAKQTIALMTTDHQWVAIKEKVLKKTAKQPHTVQHVGNQITTPANVR